MSLELDALDRLVNTRDHTLRDISLGLLGLHPNPFVVCYTLSSLYLSGQISTSQQRAAVWYTLHQIYPSVKLKDHPFVPILLHGREFVESEQKQSSLQGRTSRASAAELCYEKYVLHIIFTGRAEELSSQTPSDLISLADVSQLPCPEVDVASLEKAFIDKAHEVGFPLHQEELPNVSQKSQPIIPPMTKNHIEQTETATDSLDQLLRKAVKESLTMTQQKMVIAELERNTLFIRNSSLKPAELRCLVEENPTIAIEILLRIADSPDVDDYLWELVNMNISIHSLEVINQMAISGRLPYFYLHKFIANCIDACETVKDLYIQNRQVRLVCVFFQSLLRSQIVDMNEFMIPIQAFCIQFSRIREATKLFRMISQITNCSDAVDEGIRFSFS